MALEEQIVEWSATRPGWQRYVLRRIAKGDPLSSRECDQLVEQIVAGERGRNVKFGLADLPRATAEDPPVRLLSISDPEHVNALRSAQPLTFGPSGLTIVYGDNGSGKSGYARLLKRITRARDQEVVQTDVFRDTALEKPTARLAVRIGDKGQTVSWPDASPPELQRMLFYDGACGNSYISAESDFPYRPAGLFVMEGLIEACVQVRDRVDARLSESADSATAMPLVAEELRETPAGRFVAGICGATSAAALDLLIRQFEESSDTIDGLRDQEIRLRSSGADTERRSLTREAEKLDVLHEHLSTIHAVLGDQALVALQAQRDELQALEEAASLLAGSLGSEALPGVGTSPWKALWESARRFSEKRAYPGEPYPVADDDSLCVLCLQRLDSESRKRLRRFDQFVKEDTQTRLDRSRRALRDQSERFGKLSILPRVVDAYLKDLSPRHADLMAEVQTLLSRYEDVHEKGRVTLQGAGQFHVGRIEPGITLARLAEGAAAARDAAERLSDPEAVQRRLVAVSRKRKELELLKRIKDSRSGIVKEIARLKEREALDAVKKAAATTGITKKVTELSEEGVTEVVRDVFTRETDRLLLDRVTIARTRAKRGALLHQPKLVRARQRVKLPSVFSEGEQTALGLAAFFTEAQLDASRSALLLDDPVTSLDHVRRSLVAARLAELAASRQVVVFTHDVSFVADLKRAAQEADVEIASRSVTRSRADNGRPGLCSEEHPWKAKDVRARLGELREGLARIKRQSSEWDETAYEEAVAGWAGKLSETWERIFSQEIVGPVLAEGGLEVRPKMVRVLARFTRADHAEFDASYGRASQWTKRHDKSALVNYVAPEIGVLEEELERVDAWFKRVKKYQGG